MVEYVIETRRFSRTEYDRLIQIGVFQPGERIELVGGQLMIAEPQGASHYGSVWRTAHALEAALGSGWFVRTQAPISLDDESEPEPDVAVVPGSPRDYGREHPTRTVLTIEVSESSLAMDRLHKGSLYARAGLDDYWIVNLIDRVLEIYREPVRDANAPFGWRYARRDVFDVTMMATPLAVPNVAIRVADLLP